MLLSYSFEPRPNSPCGTIGSVMTISLSIKGYLRLIKEDWLVQASVVQGWIALFARDVTAAMLVVKNKSISLLWELNPIFMKILRENILLFWPPNMAALSRGCKPRIRWINLYPVDSTLLVSPILIRWIVLSNVWTTEGCGHFKRLTLDSARASSLSSSSKKTRGGSFRRVPWSLTGTIFLTFSLTVSNHFNSYTDLPAKPRFLTSSALDSG